MDDQLVIWSIAGAFFVLGIVMHFRQKKRLDPVFDALARKYQGVVSQPGIGMPQVTFKKGGIALRITAMSKSLDAPEGGGEITCVDFDAGNRTVRDFRIQEQAAFERTAVPEALTGQSQRFATGGRAFDSRFVGVSSNPVQTKRMLDDPSLLEVILAMPSGADIQLKDGRCCVSVDGHPQDPAFVDRIVVVAERLMESFAKTK